MKMRAARMHGYHEPLRIEEIAVPDVGAGEVLVKVAAAGMCRSDFQLIDGYFREGIPMSFPITPGHEVTEPSPRWAPTCRRRPACRRTTLIVVDPNWGDGVCRQCHEGNEQLCGRR